jgi:hypothetical protein
MKIPLWNKMYFNSFYGCTLFNQNQQICSPPTHPAGWGVTVPQLHSNMIPDQTMTASYSLTTNDYNVPVNNKSVLSPYFTYIHRSLFDLVGTSFRFVSPPYNTRWTHLEKNPKTQNEGTANCNSLSRVSPFITYSSSSSLSSSSSCALQSWVGLDLLIYYLLRKSIWLVMKKLRSSLFERRLLYLHSHQILLLI